MSTSGPQNTVDLAREPAFGLGGHEARPSTRELVVSGRSQALEPRVMQVLVALAQRRGQVVSRDELIGACWGGRAVGEDAINRCIQAIRRLAEAHGGFSIATVARVGYRLEEERSAGSGEGMPLLAVLAFDNLSGDPDLVWFSDGVSDEILQTVAGSAHLKVIGRGSSFQFRAANKAAANVAAALGASHVLDGSVRRSGGRVRISAQLVECASETTLWADRFDRELSDVLALQDEIAAAVAVALRGVFAPSSQSEPIDPAAYDLYLKALGDMGNLRNPATNVTIIDKLEQATKAAPRFARAWSCLATMRARRLRFGPPGQTYADLRGKVVEAAETALRLDPALGEPYQALSQLEPFGRYLEREALQKKALSLAANDPRVLYSAAVFAAEVGRTREALDYARQAYALDPMYLQAANRYAVLLDAEGRFEESRPLWEKFSAFWPQSEDIGWNVIQSSLHSADWARFDRLVATALALGRHSGQIELLAWFAGNLRAPDPASLQVALSQTREEFARTGKVSFARLAIGYRLGLTEEMFELIEQCSFDHIFDPETPSPDGTTSNFALIFNRSLNGSMMRDPRFPSFCARLGLCDYWVATERWPDCADAGVTPYDFKAECRRLVGA